MKRIPRFTERYKRNAARLGALPGSDRGRAVAAVIAALANAEKLPAPGDTRALIPPTHEAFVRRVQGRNLWLWYQVVTGGIVAVVGLTADPPVPADD